MQHLLSLDTQNTKQSDILASFQTDRPGEAISFTLKARIPSSLEVQNKSIRSSLNVKWGRPPTSAEHNNVILRKNVVHGESKRNKLL